MDDGRTRYSISDLAREFKITTRTIRFYEDQKLLSPRRKGQTRIYGPRERVRLKLILRGKRLGFSLREVAELLQMYDAPHGEVGQLRTFIARMGERRAELQAQRAEIDQLLAELEDLRCRCEAILAATQETPGPARRGRPVS